SVERSLGLLARVSGRTDDAVAHLERAVTHNLHLGNRPVTAVARADLAATLLQRAQPGDRVRADDLLTTAIDAAERMELDSRATRWRRLRDDVPTPAPSVAVASCLRVGDTWEIVAGDEQARVATSVGMSYLATLLAAPGEEFSAGTLAGIDIVAPKQDL